MTVIKDFFTLKVLDPNGLLYPATWRDRLLWIKNGCRHPNDKALKRLCRMKRASLSRMRKRKDGY